MPSVPPYSSTTIARCTPVRRMSASEGSSSFVPGSSSTVLATSRTVARRAGPVVGSSVLPPGTPSRSRTCRNPTTSSKSSSVTGYREYGCERTIAAASGKVRSAGRNTTSPRGRMTSTTDRFAAEKTSVRMRRSSSGSASCAITRSRRLLLRHRLAARRRVPAEQAHHQVGGAREQPDHRAHRRREAVERRPDDEREPRGPLQGDALGHELAQDERQVRDDERQRHERDRLREAGRQPQRLERRHEIRCQRRGTVRRRQEAGHRHTDLHRGQEAVRVAGHPRDARAPRSALLEPGRSASRATRPGRTRSRRRRRRPARTPGRARC